jgi:hypothetical protein
MGVSGQRHAPAALYPRGKDPRYPLDTGWASEPVWTQGLEEKSSVPVGDRTPIVQLVVRHKTAWTTAAVLDIFQTIAVLTGVWLNQQTDCQLDVCGRNTSAYHPHSQIPVSQQTIADSSPLYPSLVFFYLRHYRLFSKCDVTKSHSSFHERRQKGRKSSLILKAVYYTRLSFGSVCPSRLSAFFSLIYQWSYQFLFFILSLFSPGSLRYWVGLKER